MVALARDFANAVAMVEAHGLIYTFMHVTHDPSGDRTCPRAGLVHERAITCGAQLVPDHHSLGPQMIDIH